MTKRGEYHINTELFTMIMMGLHKATETFDRIFDENKKMWIVIGYDPQEPMVKIIYHQDVEPERTVADLLNDPTWPT